ncbi:MAG TPA: hypothetical protein VGP33_00745 [Chloroflexota bacterium]|jgi:hypothetical protein|nr:hypothetical protein [Chloroflexota bacterium]
MHPRPHRLGRGSLRAYRQTWAGVEPDAVADDLPAAARFLVRHKSQRAGWVID